MSQHEKNYRRLEELVFPMISHHLDPEYTKHQATSSLISRMLHSKIWPVRVEGLDEALAARTKGEVKYVYCANHRSEIDYFVIQSLLAERDEPAVIAAGDNLLKLPIIGPFFRRTGAHSIIRKPCTVRIKSSINSLWEASETFEIGRLDIPLLAHGYLEQVILNEPWDYMIFCEVERNGEQTKYGRSYDGSLLPFDTRPFTSIGRIQHSLGGKKTNVREIKVVPVAITWERVPEDANFACMQSMSKLVPPFVKNAWDFAYFVRTGMQNSFGVTVKFGTPLEAPRLRTGRDKQTVTQYAELVRSTVGYLHAPYETQLVATVLENRMPKKELLERIAEEYGRWSEQKMDMTNMQSKDPEAIYRRARRQFDARWREVTKEHDGRIHILRPDVTAQYHNHVRHLTADPASRI